MASDGFVNIDAINAFKNAIQPFLSPPLLSEKLDNYAKTFNNPVIKERLIEFAAEARELEK